MPDNVPTPVTQPSAFMPFGRDFDQLFNRMLRAWSFGMLEPAANGLPRPLRAFDHAPKVEVQENGKNYTISVELPGLDQKDVKVMIEGDVLTVSGEKHVERSDEKTHYSERSYGSFTRAFTLPTDADRNGITANFAKGLLTLHVPKTSEGRPKVKEIEIMPS
ncbi:MAG: Hsp20/alpha crystallin family protein [Alphaproteobacteria bacterium]|nr:Hsp20/alpha crystallin family protein [Alphaproteobacteria bacterium]MBV8413098.1 Hsp20/alpha crystallin family protein [Alphaproteobacteria bacterium]